MKHRILIFGSTWAVEDMNQRKICEGVLPYNPQERTRLYNALYAAQFDHDDDSVLATMKEWL